MATRPPDPGSGAPGESTIIFKHGTEQLLGGTELQPVIEFGAVTSPSLIFFQSRMPRYVGWQLDIQTIANVLAGAIEASMAGPYIVDMSYFQDLSPGGYLLDKMTIFWETPDGVNSGAVDVLLQRVEPQYVNPLVQAQVAQFTA